MAMVHPSRMALVPQDPRDKERERDRDREGKRGRGTERDSERGKDYRDYSPKDRGRSRSRGRDDKRRSQSPRNERRASPEYGEYKRPAAPPPWKRPENLYRGGHYGGDLESRRLQRESKTVDVWPSSPKARTRSISPERPKHKKSKRSHSTSSSEDSSEEERRRREKKERKRARREKKESRRKRRSENGDSDRDRDHRRLKYDRSRSRSHRVTTPPRSATSEGEEEQWVVKPGPSVPSVPQAGSSHVQEVLSADEEDDGLGPQPAPKAGAPKKVDERAYGGSLLRGEGSAMAAFLQDGTETRIPRRGEIGLTSDEIAAYENVGYVMSGSRHKRMNAVRMRKENQVISAEEKRGILKLQREERSRREAILREEFSELVHERLRGTDAGGSSGSQAK